jgi:ABC-type branched-subunit amino acid transport system substrate-binding protein
MVGRNRRRFAVAALCMTMALVASACGDDDDDAASETTAAAATTGGGSATTAASTETTAAAATTAGGSATTAAGGATTTTNQFSGLTKQPEPNPCPATPGISDDEIKIGAMFTQSGPLATGSAPALDSLQARVDLANSSGELGKRKIKLVVVDDTGDATRNGEVARQLVESDKVFAISEITGMSPGSDEYFNEQGIPVTGWHVGDPAWNKYPNMFTFRQANAPDPNDYQTRSAVVLKNYGASKIALIGGQNESSARFINQIGATVEQTPGMSVVYKTTEVLPAQDDFTAIVQDIKSSGADGFYTGMDFLQNTKLSQQLADAGVEMKAKIFPGGYDPRVTALPGMEGASFGIEFFPFEMTPTPPAYVEFDKTFAPDKVRNQITYIGWLSGEILVEGIKQAGVNCPTRENFINNLRLVHDWTANGAFDPVDLTTSFGHTFLCSYYVRVEGGKFVPQFDQKAVCGEPIRVEV